MRVASLDITRFRNLGWINLICASGLNLLIGPNASGKTSLLEAVYFLSCGRSFRTRQSRELIQTGAGAFRLAAVMIDAGGRRVPVGIERDARELIVRVGGAPTRSLAELARQTPVLLLDLNSHRLLEEGPKQRRRFMDWGLFHTEPGFLDVWRRYDVALRHRNAALRVHAADRLVDAWDGELSIAAVRLERFRETFCKALEAVLRPISEATLGEGVWIDYRRGWPLEPPERDFASWLHGGRDQDRQQGYTRLGPHRADFVVRVVDRTPAEALSRGQQKLLVIALVLAQAELYRRRLGDSCILLIDDLPAELDPENRMRAIRALAELVDAQLFVTAIEPGLLEIASWRESRIFQLARGEIIALS